MQGFADCATDSEPSCGIPRNRQDGRNCGWGREARSARRNRYSTDRCSNQTAMSIQKTNVVDWLGIEKGTGHIVLTVLDDVGWEDEQKHLELLEEKLNSYLAFV